MKIATLTGCLPNYDALGAYTIQVNKREYCKRHGYNLVVDCDPVSARAQCVSTFLNKPCCVVAHDSEVGNYRELLKTIKFVRHFDFIMPRTSHLSNTLDVR